MRTLKAKTPEWEAILKEGMVLTNFIQLDNKLFRVLIAECGLGAAVLYSLLLSHRNIKSNKCFPTLETLGREMGGISVRQVTTYLKRLTNIGAIKINSGKSGVANCYYFPLEDFYEEDLDANMAYRRSQGFKPQVVKKDKSVLKSELVDEDDGFEF